MQLRNKARNSLHYYEYMKTIFEAALRGCGALCDIPTEHLYTYLPPGTSRNTRQPRGGGFAQAIGTWNNLPTVAPLATSPTTAL